MHPDRLGLALRAQLPSTLLEVPDKLFLLRVDRDHRLAGSLEGLHFRVDVLELGVAVGVAGALARLGIGLQAEAQTVQQAADQLLAGDEVLLGQCRRQMALALADRPQGSLGIAADRRLHQLVQGVQKPRLDRGRRLACAAPPTNPRAEPHGARPQVCQSATDGAARKAGRPRNPGYPAATGGARFTGSEQTPVSLVQEWRKRSQASGDGSDVDHTRRVVSPAIGTR